MKTHYETLGVARGATVSEIRSAYRKLALRHHPDRSKSAESKAIFIAATESYDVLSDPDQRREYDAMLARKDEVERERFVRAQAEAARSAATASAASNASARSAAATVNTPRVSPTELKHRLTVAFARGQVAEAERLAYELLDQQYRTAIAHAVLGDLARSRGELDEAAKRYAFAAQFEPANALYQRRYEELLMGVQVVTNRRGEVQHALPTRPNVLGTGMFAAAVLLLVACFLPTPIALLLWFVAAMTAFCGLASSNYADPAEVVFRGVTGRFSPQSGLGLLALVNLWLALAAYGIRFLAHQSQNVTIERSLLFATALHIGGAVMISLHPVNPWLILAVGTPLTTFGALIGWMLGDATRPKYG
ncbi:MAG: J domain-containing protein [Fimbriimonadaceae bacterium]|nr:J domain-containing protein [Fimbriimonadaceae bacterium]